MNHEAISVKKKEPIKKNRTYKIKNEFYEAIGKVGHQAQNQHLLAQQAMGHCPNAPTSASRSCMDRIMLKQSYPISELSLIMLKRSFLIMLIIFL